VLIDPWAQIGKTINIFFFFFNCVSLLYHAYTNLFQQQQTLLGFGLRNILSSQPLIQYVQHFSSEVEEQDW